MKISFKMAVFVGFTAYLALCVCVSVGFCDTMQPKAYQNTHTHLHTFYILHETYILSVRWLSRIYL